MLPLVEDLAEDWGLRASQVTTHPNALLYSPMKSHTFGNKRNQTTNQACVYSTFLERVSEGREMSVADVDKIAQGRIWSGTDAQNIGLVDSVRGSLKDVIAYAAKLAETDVQAKQPINTPNSVTILNPFLRISSTKPFWDKPQSENPSSTINHYFQNKQHIWITSKRGFLLNLTFADG